MQPLLHSSPTARNWLKATIFSGLILCLIGASTVPFLWESKSLWYKFGLDKTLLQLGKVAGLCAAILLYLQIILALRVKLLDKIFGLDRVYLLHQLNSYIIISLAVVHVSLVLIPEGIKNLPIGWKFWPEIVGAGALLLLLGIVISAKYRSKLMGYHVWRNLHRPLGYLLILTISIHILYVSDSFENAVPKYTLFTIIGCVFATVLWVKINFLLQSRQYFDIEETLPVSESVVSLHLSSPQKFSYLPGQFAFLRFSGNKVPAEPHPFTIASAPGYNDTLQFYIKNSGDWTADISKLTHASPTIQGPFGLFSYKCREKSESLVFIAGGIGITPLLSMLRDLTLSTNPPDIVLIWCLRYRSEMFLEDELSAIQESLPNCTMHILYTREEDGQRLSHDLLEQQLVATPENSHFYLCGPEKMMKSTREMLLSLGYSKKYMYWERFAL